MLSVGLAILCFQACLVQTVFGQTRCVRSPFDYAPGLWASCYGEFGPYGFAGPYGGICGTEPIAAYGGEGIGEVSVTGELPSGGATAVVGQVPILGAVEYAGPVRAVGTVTISGTCGCGGTFIY